MVLGETKSPRPLAPATSRQEAKRLLRELTDALDEAGLGEVVDGSEEIGVRQYDLDAPTAAWMQALHEHSQRSPLTKARRRGKKKLKKKRRSK